MLRCVPVLPVVLLAVLLTATQSSPVAAHWASTGDSVVVSKSVAGGTGGPFVATNLSNGLKFLTLCLEYTEVFTPDQTYYVTIEQEALFGGVGGGGVADPLGIDTAYLYKSYVRNTLDGTALGTGSGSWVFDNANKSHLLALQDAVWYLEQEKSWSGISTMAKDLVGWAQGVASNVQATASDVRVMNLWTSESAAYTWNGRAQSMLTIIPEPASLCGWLGVTGVFVSGLFWRRRRSNRCV